MKKSVTVWRANWLPHTETFIRNQTDAMTRWLAEPLGLKRVESPIARASDRVIFSNNIGGRFGRQLAVRYPRLPIVQRHLVPGQLIHAHFLPDASLILHAAKAVNSPLLITVHGTDVTSLEGASETERARARDLMQQADRVIAVSEFLAGRVQQLGVDSERIVRLYTGIPLSPRPVEGESQKRWDVVFVGRLMEKKGPGDLMRACGVAGDNIGRAVRLAMVGYGPQEAELQGLARQLSGVDVDWLGYQEPENVRRILGMSKVFGGASKTGDDGSAEGLGMVYLEAAAEALPVVAYANGGVPEAVANGETGILTTEGDPTALGLAIGQLLENDEMRATLGQNGRTRVEEMFDVRVQTALLERVYDELWNK